MAVDVVHGDEDEDGAIEQRRIFAGNHHVSQQCETAVLAIHLAGVDGILHQQDGALCCVELVWIEDAVLRCDDDVELATFSGFAEGLDTYLLRLCSGDPPQIGHGRCIVGRGAIVGLLRGSRPIVRLAMCSERRGRESAGREQPGAARAWLRVARRQISETAILIVAPLAQAPPILKPRFSSNRYA